MLCVCVRARAYARLRVSACAIEHACKHAYASTWCTMMRFFVSMCTFERTLISGRRGAARSCHSHPLPPLSHFPLPFLAPNPASPVGLLGGRHHCIQRLLIHINRVPVPFVPSIPLLLRRQRCPVHPVPTLPRNGTLARRHKQCRRQRTKSTEHLIQHPPHPRALSSSLLRPLVRPRNALGDPRRRQMPRRAVPGAGPRR